MLKIDLLPRHFAVARANKKWLAGAVVLLLVALGFWFLWLNGIKADIARTDEELTKATAEAEKVRKLDEKIVKKEALLDPIQGQVDFVAEADKSGVEYWDRFHSINEYIWQEAQILDFSITGGREVQFTAEVRGTMGVGRFLLNLLRSSDLTNIGYSSIPGGRGIESSGAGVAGTSAPAMGRAMLGTGGLQAAAAATEGEPGSPDELITLDITATLTEPISTPQPPGAVVEGMGAGLGMGMGGMGMPGMGGMGMPGMPGMGMPDGPGMRPPPQMGPESGMPETGPPGGPGRGGRRDAGVADMEAEELEP